MSLRTKISVAAALLPFAAQAAVVNDGGTQEQRPNVLIFMLDDVGFGQLGAFGGQISTPNIDRIANMGLRYTNFHTTALCSPSRAALLTGRNHHSVGTGVITEIATSDPGYTGRIPDDKFSLVESFQSSGYRTAAFGKWHNTPLDQIGVGLPHDRRPTDLGFDYFYGFMGGDTSQWETSIWENETLSQLQPDGETLHLGEKMTDKAIAWIRAERQEGRPFFLYYSTGAMHAPHHAPTEYIDKYKGKFDMGWDQAREAIFARQKALGLFPESALLTPRTREIAAWLDLADEEKRLYARFQEVFAGYLEFTDEQFGRLLAELERTGEIDNTIIVITSDNGASGEGGLYGTYNESRFFNGLPESVAVNLAHAEDLGTRLAYNHYPAGWALAGNTPFKFYKQTTHEGGVRDPFIIAWPGKILDRGGIRHQFTHMNDVLPTLLETTDVPMSEVVNGVAQAPVEGKSFETTLDDAEAPSPKQVQYFEMLGNRAVWEDGWKAVTFHGRLPWDSSYTDANFDDDTWELYHLVDDPTEAINLADKYPRRLAAMKATFNEQALKHNVYPLDDSTGARFAATVRHIIGDRTTFTYTNGDRGIPEAAAAPTKNRSHDIVAELVIPKGGAEGAIVANGGRFGGYSLFVKDNRLHYVNNFVDEERQTIAATDPLPTGRVTVTARFTKTGENQGRMTLFVGDREAAAGDIPRTAPNTYGLTENFDVGADLGNPVSNLYESPFEFTGEIVSVRIDVR